MDRSLPPANDDQILDLKLATISKATLAGLRGGSNGDDQREGRDQLINGRRTGRKEEWRDELEER